MHVETMSESDCRAITEIVVNVFLVDVSLQFVRRCHHHEIGPLGGVSNIHHLEAVSLCLLRGRRTFTKGHTHVSGTGILEVQRMGAATAAITDDNHLLRLDQVNVCIPIVVNAHFLIPFVQIVLRLPCVHRCD